MTAELILGDPSAVLRHRVLTELLEAPEHDPEAADLARRAATSPELAEVTTLEPKSLKDTAWILCRMAHMGLSRGHPRVDELAGRVFSHQRPDGSFPLDAFRSSDGAETYSMVPLQVSLPLRGLAAVGYATDDRCERAYEWLLAQRLDDGAWPTGVAAGQPGYVAGYRRLPASQGCRVNTEAAVACLVLHPERRRVDSTRRALDLLLQRETRDEWALGTEVSRLCGVETATGFFTFYARFDLAFLLELATRAGASSEDRRIASLVEFLLARRGPAGLWEHPTHPELTRWLTFELLLSLKRLPEGEWEGFAPKVPFQPYPTRRDRSGI
jgi:hypothetical protein